MDTFTPEQRLEHLHQASQRGGILRNELLVLRYELNNLRAAVVSCGPETAATIFGMAQANAAKGIGEQMVAVQGPTNAEILWKERPA